MRLLTTLLAILAPLVASAQSGNMLDAVSTTPPSITFKQTYSEKAVNDPDYGPTAVGTGSTSVKIVSTLDGVDLSTVDEFTTIGFALGDLANEHVLADDPTWKPGKQTVSFPLVDESGEEPKLVGKITYVWTDKTLTITANSIVLELASVSDPFAYEDGQVDDSLEASVVFGDGAGSHTVKVTGKRSSSVKRMGTGEDAVDVDLIAANFQGEGDYFGPAITVLAPAKTVKTVTSATLPISLKSPAVSVFLSLNGAPFENLTAGTTAGTWTTTATLVQGPNHLEFRAEDDADGVSAAGVDIFYSVPTSLSVVTVGSGSVSKEFRGVTSQQVGETVTIKATPASGFVFAGWTGGVVSPDASITFAVTPNLQLAANFVPSPFPAVSGGYEATFSQTDDAGVTFAGGLSLTVTGGGGYSGKVLVRGRAFAFSGQFPPSGIADLTISTDALTPDLLLHLEMDFAHAADGVLNATISYADESAAASFTGARPVFGAARKLPVGLAGQYSLVLRQADSDDTSTAAYATVTVSGQGSVRIIGHINDTSSSQPFSASGSLGYDRVVRLYSPLYVNSKVKGGALSGNLGIKLAGQSDLSGSIAWYQESIIEEFTGPVAEVVIDTTLAATGSFYAVPAKNKRPAMLAATAGKATLRIVSASGSTDITKSVVINAAGVATVAGNGQDKVTLTLDPETGIFTGKFRNADLGLQVDLRGILMPSENAGTGYFVFTRYNNEIEDFETDLGTVTLTPKP